MLKAKGSERIKISFEKDTDASNSPTRVSQVQPGEQRHHGGWGAVHRTGLITGIWMGTVVGRAKEGAWSSGSRVLEDQQSPSNLSEKAGMSGHWKDFTGKLGKSLCVAEILSVCRPTPAIWWWASVSRWASEPRVRKKCWMQKRARNPLDLCCHPSFTWQPTKPWRVMALQIPVCSSLGQL